MGTVLVAPLGESPVVATAAVEALREHPDGPRLTIDRVIVPYPRDAEEISWHTELVADALRGHCAVDLRPLPLGDVASRQDCLVYLRELDAILAECANDEVLFLLAGGRKSMAALAAALCQFHPPVRALYHLLDRNQDDAQRRHFYRPHELWSMNEQERRRRMRPALKDLLLVSLPFRHLAKATELRRWLKSAGTDQPPPVATDGEAEAFWRQVFGSLPAEQPVEVWFTAQAAEQFRTFTKRSDASVERYRNSFVEMRQPASLKANWHMPVSFGDQVYAFYKKGHSAERPFLYTEPPFPSYPARPLERVVVVGLSRHRNERDYEPTSADWLRQAPFVPTTRLEELRPRGVLLAPLGESPMVITQLAVLLREREKIQLDAVALVYPGANDGIANGARLLKRLFEEERFAQERGSGTIQVLDRPVAGIHDLDSAAACEAFARGLDGAIQDVRQRFPARALHVSVSGGRKAMAALAYLAAQREGVPHAWHTVIDDPEVERDVDYDTSGADFETARPEEKARRLFLNAYDRAAFTLFEIPVIGLR